MSEDTPKQSTDQSDLIKEANQLLEDTREANQRFLAEMEVLTKGVEEELIEAGKEIDRLDVELAQFEKEAVDKMDAAVLDFIAGDEEEEE